jgi:hypothetical protein
MRVILHHLNRFSAVSIASLMLLNFLPATAFSQESKATPLQCNLGPIEKNFGGNLWNVFACSDNKSVAIVSTASSPANPFYFFVYSKGDGYGLSGEGNGQKSATQPAFDDLKKLSAVDIKKLHYEARHGVPMRHMYPTLRRVGFQPKSKNVARWRS